MDSALIYNPAFGTEDSVEEQIFFAYGLSKDSQITQLGVAQGVVELAHTFDGHPVSWLKTGTHLLIVRQLEATNEKNWRHGFWFVCGLRMDELNPAVQPESFAQIVTEGYRRWALHNGTLAAADRTVLSRWWHAFCENWTGINETGAIGVYPYLRVQPGLLSPTAVRAIDEVQKEIGAHDMLVTTFDTASFIWSGSKSMSTDSKLALQLWLAECAIAEDTAYSENSGYVFHLRRGFAESSKLELGLEPQTTPINSSELREAESGWFGISMPSLSLPSLPMPSLSLPKLPSLLPSFTPEPAAETVYPETGFVPATSVIIDGHRVYLGIYRRKMYIYTLIFDTPQQLGVAAQRSLDGFAEQLEGFSFAAAPPASFDYLVVDHARQAVHSTLQADDLVLQESVASALRDATRRPAQTEQIARTANDWWTYYLRLDRTTEATQNHYSDL